MRAMLELIRRHRAGEPVGTYSVCSAHPLVLRAALSQAQSAGGVALIEATSNQVNQEGGYTGLTPAQFRDQVHRLADMMGLPRERVLLGGDHLGPNCWQGLAAQEALARSAVLVGDYVSAGFRKIHLDCSMPLGGDPPVLDDERVAARAAALAVQAEAAWRRSGGEPPVYVVGTEVPVPGGAQEALNELQVTDPEAALATVAAHRTAFKREGLDEAWERVVGLVVQPGVEFDGETVVDYRPEKARRLGGCLESVPHLVFEAHSTDYQEPAALAALVRDHFAILKVGPALTFALREALWALDAIEREWRGDASSSRLRATVLEAMRVSPAHWRRYYHSTGAALEYELQYSLYDRIRYYWPNAQVTAALARLTAAFEAGTPPQALLSQYLPGAATAVRAGTLRPRLPELVMHHVCQVLRGYAHACNPRDRHERASP
jgi:D-tagatose-1,6-bisphosphate aldolase subunit GatZ/KbaZ